MMKQNLISLSVVFVLMLFFGQATCQKALTWDILGDVLFEEKYDEETELYWLIPQFGKEIKSYQNKKVNLKGYLIPIDIQSQLYVLSRYPYSSCFFCGGAGQESIVELNFKNKIGAQPVDLNATIQGKLILNDSDFDHFNYILEEAVILKGD